MGCPAIPPLVEPGGSLLQGIAVDGAPLPPSTATAPDPARLIYLCLFSQGQQELITINAEPSYSLQIYCYLIVTFLEEPEPEGPAWG